MGVGNPAAEAASKKISYKDAQIQALERRLELLEKRLSAREEQEQSAAASPQSAPKVAAAAVPASEVPAVKQLDQKLKVLERKLEVEREVSAENAKKAAKFEFGQEGLRFTSPEGDHTVRLRAAVQTDAKFYMDDNAPTTAAGVSTLPGGLPNGINLPDTFQLRQARIIAEGTLFKWFDFNLTPDFGKNGSTLVQYAYLDARYLPWASLSIGKQKSPISLERIQGDQDTTFLERAYPAQLASNRDVGIMLHGTFAKPGEKLIPQNNPNPLDAKNFFTYEAGVFNGSGDNGSDSNMGDTANQDNKEYNGRIFAHPFQKSGISLLEGFGIGLAGSYSSLNQSTTVLNNLLTANGQNTIVNYSTMLVRPASITNSTTGFGTSQQRSVSTATVYAGSLTANGPHTRIYPQAYWYYGSFGLMGEYALSSQELMGTETGTTVKTTTPVNGNVSASTAITTRRASASQNNSAWQIAASYVLTGEDVTFQGVKPRKPFDPFNGNWGAFQIGARWTQMNIDQDTYKNYGGTAANQFYLVDPSKSVRRASGWTIGLNWYLNRSVTIRSDYEQTYFAGGSGTTKDVLSRQMEKIFSTRFQVAF